MIAEKPSIRVRKLPQLGFVLGDLLLLDRGFLLGQVDPGGFEGGLDLLLRLIDLTLDRIDLGVPLGVFGHQFISDSFELTINSLEMAIRRHRLPRESIHSYVDCYAQWKKNNR